MFNFRRNKRQESNSEMLDVSQNLLAKVWSAKNRDGSLRVHFAFRRRSEGEEPYLSLTPDSLLELPQAIAKLSATFSQVQGIPEDVRIGCGELGILMQRLADHLNSNGQLEEKKPERSIFNLA